MSEAATKACPFCAETIKVAAVLCRYCGSKLLLAGEPAVPPPVTTPAPPAAPSDASAVHRSETLDLLTALAQKSLVVYEEDEEGQGRYRLLETVRQWYPPRTGRAW